MTTSNHHLTLRAKLIIMISVMASLFLVALDQTIIATALGRIVEDFNAYSSLSWVVTAYLITATITTPIAGKLSDLFGRRLLLLVGVTVFVAGSLLSGMSGDITQLIVWRALQGIGGGIITANAFTIVGDLFTAREQGKWQGLIGAVFGISSVIGPLLGGYLTEPHHIFGLVTDWRWTFLINIPVGIIAFIVIAIYCPPLKRVKKPRVDYAGAALLAVMLAMLVLAVDNTEVIFADVLTSTGMSLTVLRSLMWLVVVVILAVFIVVERRSAEPILDLSFFKNKNFLLLSGIAAAVGVALLGSIIYLTQFNQQVYGASPTASGLMILPMIGGLTVVSITVGQLVTHYGVYKRFMIAGFAIATAAIASLVTLTPDSPFIQEAIIIIFVGAGIGAAMPLLNIAIQNEFSQKYLGMATSSSQLFRGLGSTIGVAVLGSMLTAGIAVSLGDMKNDPYIRTVSQSPAMSQMLAGKTGDANVLLNINTSGMQQTISSGYSDHLQQSGLPAGERELTVKQFADDQHAFSVKVSEAFATSLHAVFIVTASTMFVSILLSMMLIERPLRAASIDETPGEDN